MNKTDKCITAYTDIDSLFDTRIVMLGALTELGKYDIDMKDYLVRVRDNFGTLSSIIFNYYYERRTKSVLNNAEPTYVNTVIVDYFSDALSVAKDNLDTKLYVNLYPYTLTEEENNLIQAILNKMFPSTNVVFINMPIKDITFKWASEYVNMMIFYQAAEWIENNISHIGVSDKPINSSIKEISVFGPLLLKGVMRKDEVTMATISTMKAFLGQFCIFDYLPLSYFSVRKE